MALQYMVPAAATGVSSLLSYLFRKKRPRFEETPYGKYLMEQSRYGKYSPTIRRGLFGQVSRTTGEQAQRARSRIKGGLVGRGLYGSIAGQRLMAQPGLQRMRTLGDISRQIELESEMSKTGAREAFARGRTQSEERRRAEESQARTGLLTGLAGAGAQGYQGYQLGRLAGTTEVTPTGETIKPYEPLAKATAAGIRIPYSGMQHFIRRPGIEEPSDLEESIQDIGKLQELLSAMPEEERENFVKMLMLMGGFK